MGSRRGFLRTLLASTVAAAAHFAFVPQSGGANHASDVPATADATRTVRVEHRGHAVAEYTYDQRGRLIREVHFRDPSQPMGQRFTTFTYDANSHISQ